MKRMLIIAIILSAQIIFAGGFKISIESGSNRSETLIIKTLGCYTPSDAKLIGTAYGIVNGEKKTIDLNFTHNKKGIFKVAKQWNDEGEWVIIIKGNYNGHISNAIVQLDKKSNLMLSKGKAVNDLKVKIIREDITSDEVIRLLNSINKKG